MGIRFIDLSRRYVVFGSEEHEESGGLGDYILSLDTYQELESNKPKLLKGTSIEEYQESIVEGYGEHWFELLDISTGKFIGTVRGLDNFLEAAKSFMKASKGDN